MRNGWSVVVLFVLELVHHDGHADHAEAIDTFSDIHFVSLSTFELTEGRLHNSSNALFALVFDVDAKPARTSLRGSGHGCALIVAGVKAEVDNHDTRAEALVHPSKAVERPSIFFVSALLSWLVRLVLVDLVHGPAGHELSLQDTDGSACRVKDCHHISHGEELSLNFVADVVSIIFDVEVSTPRHHLLSQNEARFLS